MFSKAKLKRFNEEVGCAPPPTKYDPKVNEKPVGGYLEKSDRWRNLKDITPGPTTYLCPNVSGMITPRKNRQSVSASRLNSSICSSASSASNNGFVSPPQPFTRSKSVRGSKTKFEEQNELKEKVKHLEEEKAILKQTLNDLEIKYQSFKTTIPEKNQTSKIVIKTLCDSSTQIDADLCMVENYDQPQDLSCFKRDGETQSEWEFASLPKEELQILQDQIEHLTMLRNNLEASVANKEDTIADLQMQIDLIVIEAEESHEEMQVYKEQVCKIQEELQKTFEEKGDAELKVKDLITKYERLMNQQQEERRYNNEIMAQKDIEIELLNDSVATLNTQVSEYNKTISRIQSDVSLKKSQISSLEVTVGDLSIATKEREFVEVMLEDEIKEKDKEVVVLEKSLEKVEEQLLNVVKERDEIISSNEALKAELKVLEEQLKHFELNLKEKEVLQQFLEKEMSSREAEVTESNFRLANLEDELEKTRKIALDLQQEAEMQLNEVISLKASLSVKNFEIEYKEDLITSLKEEVDLNVTSAINLKKCMSNSEKLFSKLEQENIEMSKKIVELEEELCSVKSSLKKEENNTKQLEERIIDLMSEIGDRDSEHEQRLIDKDSEIDELSVKYSEALLEQESAKRLLSVTSGVLEKETLLLQATERELKNVQEELTKKSSENIDLESSVKELAHKLIHIEDALSCEEAAASETHELLQKHIKESQSMIEKLNQEKQSLQTSNEGFMSQINMLRICMTKKSVAVEEMQTRIETLREEKNILTDNSSKTESILRDKESLLIDLQNEFEGRLKIITDLQITLEEKELTIANLKLEFEEKVKARETKIDNIEEEKNNLLYKVSHLENQLKELQEEGCNYKAKVIEFEDKVNFLKEEKLRAVQNLSNQLENEKQKSIEISTKLEILQQSYEGYEDQLNNMQTLLMDKTSVAENLQQQYSAANIETESFREKVEDLQSNLNALMLRSGELQTEVTSKNRIIANFEESLAEKNQKIKFLEKNSDEKQGHLLLVEKKLCDVEKSFGTLNEEKNKAATTACHLQEQLTKTKEEIARLSASLSNENEQRISKLISDHNIELEDWKNVNIILREEAESWKNKFDNLEKLIEPFREQLDAFEAEKAALVSKSEAEHEEVAKLSGAYAKLLGHNNHKQKIQHVVKLKTENVDLKEKIHKLQLELEKQKKAVRRLEDKFEHNSGPSKGKLRFDKENKENSSMLAPANTSDFPQVTSTPLRSVRYHRL